MKLYQSPRMSVANAVLAELMKLDGPPLMLEGYVNGREYGYSVTNYRVRCSFAQDRNSDTIVVQYGKTLDFNSMGNVLHGDGISMFGRRAYFEHPESAASFIETFMINNPSTVAIAEDENHLFSLQERTS